MNSAVPLVNCVQIKHPNPRGMNENDQEQNLKDKKKQEHKTNELFNSVIIFFLCLLMS